MKLKHLFTEEKVDDHIGHDYKIKVRNEMHHIAKAIAAVLKTASYRIHINISSQQEYMARKYNVKGIVIVLNTAVPEDHDSAFFTKMVGKLVERELMKRFNQYAIWRAQFVPYTTPGGTKADTTYITFMVPDADGSFSVNTQP